MTRLISKRVLQAVMLLLTVTSLPLTSSATQTTKAYEKAERFRKGKGVMRSPALARDYYKLACDANHALGCWRLAQMLPGSAQKQTVALLQKACKLGLPDGCEGVSALLLSQKKSRRAGLTTQRRACKMGSGVACYKWFKRKNAADGASNTRSFKRQQKRYARRRRDRKKIQRLLHRGCTKGMETDCFLLGYLHFQGVLRKGRKHAAKLFRKACFLAHANACDFYALMKGNGLGIKRNLGIARRYHKRACTLGLSDGCTNYGGLLFRGLGGKQDLPEARRLFQKACQRNNGQACLLLGEMQVRGEGGARDAAGTLKSFEKSCQLGIKQGCQRHAKLMKVIEEYKKQAKKTRPNPLTKGLPTP